ncbi:MAG: glycosyltransferase family 2 protein, partial [Muribaculaceae bacterium]|nr:glycosyltransferase family 2 protein [Muribaculaceae bacterium]
MTGKRSITILIPAYNEAKRLPALADAVTTMMQSSGLADRYDWNMLVVDDGSRDDTPQVLHLLRERNPHVDYVRLSRNFGKENAMLAGMDHAAGDCVVIMDADLQHPVDTVPEMVKWWEEGYDDVYLTLIHI